MKKEFKTLDEQIEILKMKGLMIEDENEAKDILLRENYFFLNGYRHLLVQSDNHKVYLPNATFRELYSLFLFDRHFRNIMFKNLLIVENNMKSIFSYQMSKKYGYKEKEYLNIKNFTSDPTKIRRVKDLLEKMKRQIRVNSSQHNATMHYITNYGYIPLWILVKVLSFGIIGDLYSILKEEDRGAIADVYNISDEQLELFLPLLANYRNLCAHEDIVFENKTERNIPDTIYHERLSIPKMDEEYKYGKNDIFSIIIILKHLLKPNEFRIMMREIDYEIQTLNGRISSIPIDKVLDRMGFPKNYMEIIDL